MSDGPCVYCAIVAREVPSAVVREDERTVSFLTIEPAKLELVAARLRGEGTKA